MEPNKVCSKCSKHISEGIWRFTWNTYGRPLCLDHQYLADKEAGASEKFLKFKKKLHARYKGGEK